jgi:phosphatidate cytidylyltransferase
VLAQRVASAAVGIPVIFLLIFIGGWTYAIALAIVLAIAGAEFQHLQFPWWWSIYVVIGAIATGGMAIAGHLGDGELVLWLVIALLVPIPISEVAQSLRYEPHAVRPWVWIAAGTAYVGILGSYIVLLRDLDDGRDWVLLALLTTFATDTAAYFTGRALGRHKMAPRISPKKTWDGFAGGYAGGFAAAVALNYVLGLRIDPVQITALGLLIPGAAVVGDLAESALKRWTGVKDASELIPGHGGVLDRLDSVLFTFAVTYLFLQWIVL